MSTAKKSVLLILSISVLTLLLGLGLNNAFSNFFKLSDHIIVNEITDKAQQALVLGDFTELRKFKASLDGKAIGYVLKNRWGEDIDAYQHAIHSTTTAYQRIIYGRQNNVANFLLPRNKAENIGHTHSDKEIGRIDIFVTHSHPLIKYRYFIALILSVLFSIAVYGVFLQVEIEGFKKKILKKERQFDQLNAQFEFYTSTLKSIFRSLSTDFKVASDILAHTTSQQSAPNDYVAAYARNKIDISLHSLLTIKDKIFTYEASGSSGNTIYFAGNLNKSEILTLCFKVNGIQLERIGLQSNAGHLNKPVVLIDLDPLVNDHDGVICAIDDLPENAYIIGILPHEYLDNLPDSITFRLDWTLMQPIDIDECITTINKRPSVSKMIESAT